MEILSLRWNIIKFDKISKNKDIEDILKSRFEGDDYLEKTLDDLHDPFLFKDMQKAVDRIISAYSNKQRVVIFWDYDVDWVTSTSILMHFFKKIWIQASYRLPHRKNDWYWLKKYFIDELSELWVSLIVTVDCGTRDLDVIEYAYKKQIDIIVTDHHSVPDIISEYAVAIINPKRIDCQYPYKNLAWAWVAFKLMQALAIKFLPRDKYFEYIKESIDIAAIWTVADCMDLRWENRTIVELWLKQIKNSRSRWIRKLIEDKINDDLDADIFWFSIWPKLNSAWRMDTPYKAINIILNNSDEINNIILDIEWLNDKRKYLTKIFYEEALSQLNTNDNIIFYISEKIEHWIIWIIAWKLCENFYKPVLVLKDEWDRFVASCRSTNYFSIISILEQYKDYFISFWGHKQAAWFSIFKDKFLEFRNNITKDINLMDFSKYKKELFVDKIVDLEELWFEFLSKINKFKPFWIWNLKPLFIIEDFQYTSIEFLWKWRDHLKFLTKNWYKIIAFFMWIFFEEIKLGKLNWKKINLIFDISEDNFLWKKSLLLKVVDIVLK